MTAGTSHRLWPVLTVLVCLVAGAGAVEVFAAGREAPAVTIQIGDGVSLVASGEEGESEAAEDGPELAVGSPAVDAEHERARQLARRGELDAALALFTRVVAAHPSDASVRTDHAFWLVRAHRPVDAIAELEVARSLRPDDAQSAFILATAYKSRGNPERAESWYREALRIHPELSSARIALARLLLRMHRPEEAKAAVAPATRAGGNSERARALGAFGQACLALGRRDEADRAFREAIERAPAQPELRISIARALADSGRVEDVDRAIVLLQQAVTIAPDLASVHVAMGRVLEQLDDDAGAERAFRKALALEPGDRFARRRLLRLALRQGDYRQAREHAARLVAEDPEDAEHHFLAALVESRDGRLEEARQSYQRAIALREDRYPEAWFNLGLLERGAGRREEALAAYRQAVELDPDYRTAWNNMGLVLASLGRHEEAESAYRRAIALRQDYGPALVNLAMLLSARGRHDEAIPLLERAIASRAGRYREARLDLGVVHTRAGRTAEAIRIYRELIEAEPRYSTAHHNLGEVLEAEGRLDEALASYERATELDGERTSSRARVAALLAARGESERAARAYEDLLDRDPHHREARRGLASLYLEMGDRARCRLNAGMAAADDPADHLARELLRRCTASGASTAARSL